MNRFRRRQQTRRFLSKLYRDQHKVLVIHYSCESLTDDNEGFSPRITSIAVQNLRGDFQKSFSIHLIAEELKIKRDEIEEHYNRLELKMLDNFYQFVKDNTNRFWLNWNMKNINYGFEAIEHRYNVLGGNNYYEIPYKMRVNISLLFNEIYGRKYVDNPKFYNLLELNFGDGDHDIINGAEEAQAFDNKEFVRLHKSTLAKISRMARFVQLASDGRLKVSQKSWFLSIEDLLKHPLLGIIGILAVIISIITGIIFVIEKYF